MCLAQPLSGETRLLSREGGSPYRGLEPRAIGGRHAELFSEALLLALLSLLAVSGAHAAQAAEAGEVNVYSYRQPYLIDPLFKDFTVKTGIKVNVIFAEKGLIERIAAEGRNSPADVLLTVDVGNLMQAKDAGIGQPILGGLGSGDPAAYRDGDGIWWGLRAAPAWSMPPRNG